MTIFTARIAAKRFGEVLDACEEEPVVIHRHGRRRAAVVGWRLFQSYLKCYDDYLAEKQASLLEKALDAHAAGHAGLGAKAVAMSHQLGAMREQTTPLLEKKRGA